MNLFSINTHYVKTAGRQLPVSMCNQVKHCHSADDPLFFSPYRRKRTSTFSILSVFHFNKYQISSIPSNEIDLTTSAAEISFPDLQSFFFQECCSNSLIIAALLSSIFFQKNKTFLFLMSVSFVSYFLYKMCDKRFSVYRTWPVFLQCFNMCRRSVTFVGGKSILRKDLVIFFHHPISGHFRHNA